MAAAPDTKAQNRYRVIERIESGGMAEVFRGEAESLAGFKKAVAIKRVLPHLAQNDKFIRMFLDEARLCARLNHANIVQVFDIGHVENTYFIVMEFVDGVNLKAVIEHLKKKDARVPLNIAVYASMQICNGLQYAHDLTDGDGAMLGIVHRDMSPPNVLISRRGEVKIVDFGLAKAAMQVEKSEPGVVKGKFSYLAPETALGEVVDHQADIFAVGIMLWEMLAGKRLFMGDSDVATVRMVQKAEIPSLRRENPEVPEELEAVVRKSLAKNKSERYQSAEALAQDLAQFLATHRIAVNSFDLAKVVKEVAEEKRAARAKEGKSKAEGSIIGSLIQEELVRFTSIDDTATQSIAEGSQPIELDAVSSGAKPLDSSAFVDTNDWASGLLDGDDFDPNKLGDDGWKAPSESAHVDLASQLEGDDNDGLLAASSSVDESVKPPIEATKPTHGAGESIKAVVGSKALANSIPKEERETNKSNGALMAVAVVALLAIAGVGLYVAGVILH